MEDVRPTYRQLQKGDVILEASSDNTFEEYVQLDAGEPLRAHVVDVKDGEKTFQGEPQQKLFVYFEVDEGPGTGQRYRGDFNPKLTSPTSPKQSNLSKFASLVYGEPVSKLDPVDLLGRPVRILLSAPWGDKQLQFVDSYLKPSPDQKVMQIERKEPDVVLTEIGDADGKLDLSSIPF